MVRCVFTLSTINKIFLRLDLKKSEPAVVRPNVLSAAQTGLKMMKQSFQTECKSEM